MGSNKQIDLDVRLICATNSPLHELVSGGSFRQDLFYRIKTVEILLPPLRERREDIPLLVNHYLDEFGKRYHKTVEVDSTLMQLLVRYHWPGNIRELQHAMERAVILSKQPMLTVDDFQLSPFVGPSNGTGKTLNLSDVEKEVIREAIKKSGGNLTKAAEELGIGRTTLYRKMEAYGIAE